MTTATKPISFIKIMKKISIIHTDGSRVRNLKAETAAEIIKGLDPIPAEITIDVDDKNERRQQAMQLGFLCPQFKSFETESGFLLQNPIAQTDINSSKDEQEQEEIKPIGPKPGLPYIILDKGLVYIDAHESLKGIAKLIQNKPLPNRYKNSVTATFQRGSISGQIRSLFKDLKRFGLAIQPKIRDFRDKAQLDLKYADFISFFNAGLLPTDPETLTKNGKVNMDLYKMWALFQICGLD